MAGGTRILIDAGKGSIRHGLIMKYTKQDIILAESNEEIHLGGATKLLHEIKHIKLEGNSATVAGQSSPYERISAKLNSSYMTIPIEKR
jgi:hypothetical protein